MEDYIDTYHSFLGFEDLHVKLFLLQDNNLND